MSEPYTLFSILDDAGPDMFLGAAETTPARVSTIRLGGVVAAVCGIEFVLIMLMTFVAAAQVGAGGVCAPALVSAVGVSIVILNLFSAWKLYRIEVIGDFRQFCGRFVSVLVLLVIAGLSLYEFGGPAAPGGATAWRLVDWFVLSVIGVVGFRFAAAKLFALGVRRGLITHKVVVLGSADLATRFIERAEAQRLGVRVTAVFEHGRAQQEPNQAPRSGPSAGVAALLRHSRRNHIDTVVIALPFLEATEVASLISQLKLQPLRIRLTPCPSTLETKPHFVAPAGELPGMNLLHVADLPIDGAQRVLKTVIDIAGAGFALLFFGPLMLICALGIKLSSPGPILFRQTRIGYRNDEFSVYKFRTMHQAACNTGWLTMRNDPRVFKFGSVLRKLSLDELPQLLNVIKGDMSLVGPRPHMPDARAAGIYYHQAVPEYAERHRVKPGITGLAQVSGWRGPTETIEQIEQRVSHDLKYIESWSIWLDLKILAKTVLVGFFGKNAF